MNGYRHLSGHLEQLAATLVGLGRQMRDSVATAVSRSAAEASGSSGPETPAPAALRAAATVC
jgi:hypothetical protein